MKKKTSSSSSLICFKTLYSKYLGSLAIFILTVIGTAVLQNVVIIELIGRISSMLISAEKKTVLIFVLLFLIAYLLAGSLKYIGILMQATFVQNIVIESEQDFLRVYGDISYKDYYFDNAKVMGQMRKAAEGMESAARYICTVTSTVVTLMISVTYLSYLNFYAIFCAYLYQHYLPYYFIKIIQGLQRLQSDLMRI